MIGLLSAQAHAGERIEILVPPKDIGTKSSTIHVVGTSDAPEVVITAPGTPPQRVAVKNGVFHAHVSFGYGLHDVVLSLPDSPSAAETLTVLVSPQQERKYDAFFPWYRFHSDRPSSKCLACHTAPDLESTESHRDAPWCLDCHDEIRELFRSHIPGKEPTCSDCHHVRSDLTLTAVGVGSNQNPCFACHEDEIGKFDREYIHGPVAGGTCTVCHSPHGSRFEKNLLTDPGILCISCHPMEEINALPVQHKPFSDGNCIACHDPHATNNRWVLVRRSEELCLTCHDGGEGGDLQAHTHPYNVKPRKRLAQALQLTDQGWLDCVSCHSPHATSTEHLLRTTQANACAGCHPEHQ